ncbi:hypothetical protein QP027_00870 [Corynebacterium breve]|uniref:Uncharacterized protein n=1 Tax=Corynebacterium breve TaxID=3049799 RepID=A0ABY8VK87_9CORY|nr:hypothetical protein [Corynebacterium breve]WIM67985.1 hypothetical protein QP027_00870 [Corynebacterium breve]
MSAENSVADIKTESHPEYSGGQLQDTYIDGYEPNSLTAPHSSLQRTSTWVAMGMIMAGIATCGILIYGIGTGLWGNGTSPDLSKNLTIIGAILTVVFFVGGAGLLHYGRRYYRQYRAETGRKN